MGKIWDKIIDIFDGDDEEEKNEILKAWRRA